MKKSILWMMAGLAMAILYQNCGSEGSSSGSDSAQSFNTNSIESLVAFERNLDGFLSTNCRACHQTQSAPLFVGDTSRVSHDLVVNLGLVNFGSPRDSRLVLTVARGHESIPSNFSDYLTEYISDWADELRRANDPDDPTPPAPEPFVNPNFQSIYNNILVRKCIKCHSPDGIRPQEDYTSYARTRQTGGVVAGNAGASRMYLSCEDGSMPGDTAPLNDNQLGALRDWINDGAPDN